MNNIKDSKTESVYGESFKYQQCLFVFGFWQFDYNVSQCRLPYIHLIGLLKFMALDFISQAIFMNYQPVFLFLISLFGN